MAALKIQSQGFEGEIKKYFVYVCMYTCFVRFDFGKTRKMKKITTIIVIKINF